MSRTDQEILEDMLCVLMPSSSEPLAEVARQVLASDWLAEHDRAIAKAATRISDDKTRLYARHVGEHPKIEVDP